MKNTYITTWQMEREIKTNEFIESMALMHGIEEITTRRQFNNGTRAFITKEGIRFQSYESGYVRIHNKCSRIYQINPTYEQEYRVVHFDDKPGGLKITKGTQRARALIFDPVNRLMYITNYYLRNYKYKTKKNG